MPSFDSQPFQILDKSQYLASVNDVVGSLAECGLTKEAVGGLVAGLPQHQLHHQFTADVMRGLKHSDSASHALFMLDALRDQRCDVDVYHYAACINACAKMNNWQKALSLLRETREVKVDNNKFTYSSCISACGNAGEWVIALGLLSEMDQQTLDADDVAYTACISSCERGGEWQKALSLLLEMDDLKIDRTTITYSACMNACGKAGQWQLALGLLSEMGARQINANAISCATCMRACSMGGQWELALAVLKGMAANAMIPDATAYSACIDACSALGQWRQTLGLLSHIRTDNMDVTDFMYNSCVISARNAGQWQCSHALLLGMSHVRCVPDLLTYSAVLRAFDKAMQWDRALDLLTGMIHKTITPHGTLGGSVVNLVRKALGRTSAVELLEHLRGFWLSADDIGSQLLNLRETEARRDGIGNLEGWFLSEARGVFAIAKPAGISTQDAVARIAAELQLPLSIVSRLDLPTSGVLPIAIGVDDSAATHWLRAQYAGRLVLKEYLCLCTDVPNWSLGAKGEISSPLEELHPTADSVRSKVSPRGREAVTRYEVCAMYAVPTHRSGTGFIGLLRALPLTGRAHQIRAHFASINMPVVGDRLYTILRPGFDNTWCPRLFLHCHKVGILAIDGKQLSIKADLSDDLSKILAECDGLQKTMAT